jgi:hypothetical protein
MCFPFVDCVKAKSVPKAARCSLKNTVIQFSMASMKKLISALLVIFSTLFTVSTFAADSFYSLTPNSIDGKPQSLAQY